MSTTPTPRPTPSIGAGLRASAATCTPSRVTDLFLTLHARTRAGAWALAGQIDGEPVVVGKGSWTAVPSGGWGKNVDDLTGVLDQVRSVCGDEFRLAVSLDVSGPGTEPLAIWAAEHRSRSARSSRVFAVMRLGQRTCEELLADTNAATRTVYTDGSARRSRGQGGAAWVDDDGNFAALPVDCGFPVVTEIAAITAALEAIPAWVKKVIIKSDSREAVRTVNEVQRTGSTTCVTKGPTAPLRKALDQVSKHARIEVKWVKGHKGNVLNECADRLAVLARRTHDAGLSQETLDQRAQNVVIETFEKIRGVQRNEPARTRFEVDSAA